MASLDFVYDIVDKLNEEKVDYLVVSIQHAEKESRSDIFYNLSDDRSPATMAETLDKYQLEVLSKYIDEGDYDIEIDDDDDPEPEGA